MCADKGYSGEPALQAIKERKYIPHIKLRRQDIQEKKTDPRRKAHRWVVEVTHSCSIASKAPGEVREALRDLRSCYIWPQP